MKRITIQFQIEEEVWKKLIEFFTERELKASIKEDILTEIYDLYRAKVSIEETNRAKKRRAA